MHALVYVQFKRFGDCMSLLGVLSGVQKNYDSRSILKQYLVIEKSLSLIASTNLWLKTCRKGLFKKNTFL